MQGEWDEGLLEIASSRSAHPVALLQFFPTLLQDADAAAATLPASQRSKFAVNAEAMDSSGLAGTERVPLQQDAQSDNASTHATEQVQEAAPPPVATVLPYLVTLRSRLMSSTQGGAADSDESEQDSSASSQDNTARQPGRSSSQASLDGNAADRVTVGDEAGISGAGASQAMTAFELQEARASVDLALVRAWLQAADYGALLGLLRQQNAIPLDAGEATLRAAGAYRELVR